MKFLRKLFRNLKIDHNHHNIPEITCDTEDLNITAIKKSHYAVPEAAISSLSTATSKLYSAIIEENENDVIKTANRFVVNRQDSLQRTPLHLAVMKNNLNIINILISCGASSEVYDNDGLTPFLKAVDLGNIEAVKIFLNRKLNSNQTDLNGNSALHIAVKNKFYNLTELLVRNYQLVNLPNKTGEYPLHIATQKESYSIALLLLEHGAQIDAMDKQKRTSLLIAVKIGNKSLVELFLKQGANSNCKDITGTSVDKYALLNDNPDIKELFYSTSKNLQPEKMHNYEDSQTSEQSFTLPPILEAPKSWKILHPNDCKPKINRHKVRSLSPSFETTLRFKLNKQKYKSSSSLTPKCDDISQKLINTENFEEVLDTLSHDVLPKLEPKSSMMVHDNENRQVQEGSNKLNKNKFLFELDQPTDTSSEEQLFWKDSTNEERFTKENSIDNIGADMTKPIRYDDSSTDGDDMKEEYQHQRTHSEILNQLKTINQKNQELELESSMIKEYVEKLKFDLNNSEQLNHTNDLNLNQMNSYIQQLDTKYEAAINQINSFQLVVNNLEQEVIFLRKLCEKPESYNTNEQFISKEHERKIYKLEAEVIYWKTKYEEIASRCDETQYNNAEIGIKNFLTIRNELHDLKEKMKDCLSRVDLDELHSKQEVAWSDMMQQILIKADQKLQSAITEMKCHVIPPVDENVCHKGFSDDDLKLLECQNMNKKLSLEVSRLTCLLKDKEITEQRLTNELDHLKADVQALKMDRTKSFLQMVYEKNNN